MDSIVQRFVHIISILWVCALDKTIKKIENCLINLWSCHNSVGIMRTWGFLTWKIWTFLAGFQNSSGKRTRLVTAGSDAEETLRLHEDHHQQKGPAQVGFSLSHQSHSNIWCDCILNFFTIIWSLQRILWAERVDDGGGGSRHRGAARRPECHRCQFVYEGGGPGLSGDFISAAAAFTAASSVNITALHNVSLYSSHTRASLWF